MHLLNLLCGRHPEPCKAQVEIYTWRTCPYCIAAKFLLWRKGVNYIEYKIDGDEGARAQMAERARRRTVPQIFVNNHHLGGCDELYQAHRDGSLDPQLAQTAP